MKRLIYLAVLTLMLGCQRDEDSSKYLFVWAGDSARTSSDFLAVIDADPASATYGSVLNSLPTGTAGSMPHHTEAEMPMNGHLLANGFAAGKTWLFDLTNPLSPKILTSFGGLAGFTHPHTYERLTNGNVLTTFQYLADTNTDTSMTSTAGHHGMSMPDDDTTGGLVEMDERGNVIRSSSAQDTTIADRKIYPYAVLSLPSLDRAISTTTDMNPADTAPMHWVQLWRLSDLSLLKSLRLPSGPLGTEQRYTGEIRLLPDGKSAYVHTFGCGLYHLSNLDNATPTTQLVYTFPGENCGVPVLAGNYWLQPVPELHALVALDIRDPLHPREVSSVVVGKNDEEPHWIAIDRTRTRIVLN